MTNLTHAWVWTEDGKLCWRFSRCYHDSLDQARACVQRRFTNPRLLSEPFPADPHLRPYAPLELWEGDEGPTDRILIFRWTDEDEDGEDEAA